MLSRRAEWGHALVVIVAATLCLVAAPTAVFASAVPGVPHLSLSTTVNIARATVGRTLMYTVTLRSSGPQPANNVIVDDVLGGDAGYVVNDGTHGTANSWSGSSVITVTKVATGHYRWTYATVNAGDTDVVRFTAVITLPPIALSHSNGFISLTNTASTPGIAPVTVSTTAPYTGRGQGGGVGGVATGTPGTGVAPDVAAAGVAVLVGIGLILIALVARKAEKKVAARAS